MTYNHPFNAKWIWHKSLPHGGAAGSSELVYFRRTFELPDATQAKLTINVSADSRYRLFVNGQSAAVGPCKGDRHTHYYETVDVSSLLRPGRNVIAAKVLHYATSEPFMTGAGMMSVWRSDSGGFLLDGTVVNDRGEVMEELHTDERWVCTPDHALSFEMESWMSMFLGGVERVDGTLVPHGYEQPGFDDSAWSSAIVISETIRNAGILTPWQLTPRPIPPLYETQAAFKRIMRRVEPAGIEADREKLFFSGKPADSEPLLVPANSSYIVELDAGELTTGYLRMELVQGAGARIRIQPSECYEGESTEYGIRNKAVRDNLNGTSLQGDSDHYLVAGIGGQGSRTENYEPFWFRTFRFVRLEIRTADEPLMLASFHYRETGYPLQVKANFSSSDETFDPLWRISLNTLKRCMHETYEDCPYYEQLQYTMDTRLQALFTYQISGDDRLARRAIHDFHSSLLPSGMLQSRYPSVEPQVIPGFSLHWIYMVYDHFMFVGDKALVRKYRPTIDAVLGWFEERLDEEGMVGPNDPAYWNWVDWVKEWPDGIPPSTYAGSNTAYSLQYAIALDQAAYLNEMTERPDTGAEYRKQAIRVRDAVKRLAWSPARRMFKDSPAAEQFSQHMQMWAVVAGIIEGEEAADLIGRTLDDDSLPKLSYSNGFYMFRALAKAGLYDRADELWEGWRKMMRWNMTTWAEDPYMQRSDCHAWGAVPLHDFLAETLGISPAAPGYALIRIQPRPGSLDWACGTAMTPHGPVNVDWRIRHDRFHIRILRPTGIPVEVCLPDGTVRHVDAEGADIYETDILFLNRKQAKLE